MTTKKLIALAAFIVTVAGAAPAHAFDRGESTCFFHNSGSGSIKICSGDTVRVHHDDDARYAWRQVQQPLVYNYYYGPQPQFVRQVWYHEPKHKHHKRCNHHHGHRDYDWNDRDRHDHDRGRRGWDD